MFFIAILICWLAFSGCTSAKIARSVTLSRGQKISNIVLNCLLPGIWFYIVSAVIFPKQQVITKAERDRMIRMESGSKIGESQGTEG